MSKEKDRLIPAVTVMVAIFLLIFVLKDGIFDKTSYKEIENIKSLTNTGERIEELEKLLDRVGPLETQEQLFLSGLPFTGETHLLIHTVGDFIYDKYGLDGLPLCKDYFLSACHHAFIINALADYGMGGMTEVMSRCESAGIGVGAQCAHGAGHGFVAWHDYNLIKAAEMCDELGGSVDNFAYFNCYDGVFMENLWGVHNGVPSEKRWISETDIYYPCTDKRIPEKYLNGCWSNQATRIYQYYQGDLRKTAMACDAVENSLYRETCYNNFSRQINPLTGGDVDKVFSLCANATGKHWQDYCVLTNVNAYWSVGDRVTPFGVCDRVRNTTLGNECFGRLVDMIKFYYSSEPNQKEIYCNLIGDKTNRDRCKEY